MCSQDGGKFGGPNFVSEWVIENSLFDAVELFVSDARKSRPPLNFIV
jgi:hypothetical protein